MIKIIASPMFDEFLREKIMKDDEKIVCRNATVLMDSKGNLSYINNESVLCYLAEDENDAD